MLGTTFLVSSFVYISVSEPDSGARAVPPRALNDDGPEAPHVHPTVRSPGITHGTERLPWCSHARAGLPPDAWPDGPTARFPNDANAGPARTQAHRGRPQPAQRTTIAAPAPAAVTAGTRHCWKCCCSVILEQDVTLRCVIELWGGILAALDF